MNIIGVVEVVDMAWCVRVGPLASPAAKHRRGGRALTPRARPRARRRAAPHAPTRRGIDFPILHSSAGRLECPHRNGDDSARRRGFERRRVRFGFPPHRGVARASRVVQIRAPERHLHLKRTVTHRGGGHPELLRSSSFPMGDPEVRQRDRSVARGRRRRRRRYESVCIGVLARIQRLGAFHRRPTAPTLD